MIIIQSPNNKFHKLINSSITQHICYWIFFTGIFVLIYGSYENNYIKSVAIESLRMPTKMLLVYFTVYPLMSKYLFKGKFVKFILWYLLVLFILSTIQRVIDHYIVFEFYLINWGNGYLLDYPEILNNALRLNTVLVLPFSIKLIENRNRYVRKMELAEKSGLETELMFLKNQLYPHFFFNTLNSIYSMVIQKSDLAPDMIVRLSDLMRYMLYETRNKKFISLEKEVNHISNYIEIEKIRFQKNCNINYSCSGNYVNKLIAPMILLTFIENGFKHFHNDPDSNSFININISVSNSILYFYSANSYSASDKEDSSDGGIGLSNIKRRLELLYHNKYELNIESDSNIYSVMLKLDLQMNNSELPINFH